MIYLKWHDSYSVGNEELDDHHRYLISLLNQSQKMVLSNAGVEDVQKLLLELLDYSVIHCWVEETWMKEIGYPRHHSHIKEHKAFTDKISYIQNNYSAIEVNLAVLEVFIFLQEWLINHIIGSDGQIREYVLNNMEHVFETKVA